MTNEYLTAILVFITAIYAYLTHRLAKASEASVDAIKEQSEAMLRPYVTVCTFIRPHTPFLYLRISNTGRSEAKNLRLSIDKDFFQFGEANQKERNLRAMAAFNKPIRNFAPGAELMFALGPGWAILGKENNQESCPAQFNITASYEFAGKFVEELHEIDLEGYFGSEGSRDPIVEELERIRKAIEKREN